MTDNRFLFGILLVGVLACGARDDLIVENSGGGSGGTGGADGPECLAEVSAGEDNACARKTDGTLWCWGDNQRGQIGDGTTTDRHAPVEITALGAAVAAVSVGFEHTCAIKTDGTLWCWGDNGFGQLGDGTEQQRLSPIEVETLGATVAQVSAGATHTCSIKRDGTLWCWGHNAAGQLGDGTQVEQDSPVEVSALGATVAEISVGYMFTCATKSDRTLWCWGFNAQGQVGTGDTANRPLPAEITAFGATVAALSTASLHTCAIQSGRTLWCWGFNGNGALGDGTTVERHSPTQVTELICP